MLWIYSGHKHFSEGLGQAVADLAPLYHSMGLSALDDSTNNIILLCTPALVSDLAHLVLTAN